jgi:FixJ family two-component response regulator
MVVYGLKTTSMKKMSQSLAAPLQYYFPWINKLMKNKPEIVYVVDDDEAVRDSLTWLLESNGYVVKCLPSAERFLQSLAGDNKDNVACLILDVRMPGMSGLELQERLMAEGIPMPISFITGHGDVSMAVSTMEKRRR